MKKIILIVLSLLLSACTVSKSVEIKNINFEKTKLYEINLDINPKRYTREHGYTVSIIAIDEEYTYLKVQYEDERCYRFYKQDKSNNIELIYQFEYTRDQEPLHSTYAKVVDKKLIIGFVDHLQLHTKILIVSENNVEVIYDDIGRAWILSATEDYIILNEKYDAVYYEGDNGNDSHYVQSLDENYKNIISKINLKTKEKEILIDAEYLVNEEKMSIKGEYIQDITQIYSNGFIYKDKKNCYYYNLETNQIEKIMTNKYTYNSLYGNSNLFFTYELSEDKLHFIADKNKDYYIDLKNTKINTSIYQDIYMNDNYLYIALIGNVFLYDIKNNILLSYEYDDLKEYGDYHFYNNKIYYMTRDSYKMTIYECEISVE